MPRRDRARRRTSAMVAGVAAVAVLAGTASAAGGAAEQRRGSAADQRTHEVEYFSGPGGHGRHVRVPAVTPERIARAQRPLAPAARSGDGEVTPIARNGSVADKLDVVVIGDGYTADQQADFQTDARATWERVSEVAPYDAYRGLFNVWAVGAVSRDSGVSGDPTRSVVRDTALGSYFWCDGLERLLCVDTDKVESYAAKAPAADLVIVVSNATKYGGAGYNDVVSGPGYDGIATVSSDHPDSAQVAVHETGHSLGKLADEYVYEEYGTYTGPERPAANASTLGASAMADRRAKWYRWLGQPSPDGGTVGAYEGGDYYPRGINRPTENSIMRTLGREFNLPGREAMIAGFYRHASVLSSATPTDRPLARGQRVRVQVPASASVRWYVDGREVRAARGKDAVTPAALGVRPGGSGHRITARATDDTAAVRDPKVRESLTDSRSWRVRG
ncbi:M64 family metallopeptidase [Streptomyces sp. NPDC057702]|uniref:M64 family metallopeptidase n=1 Tax=unclassified Streptomyces TaxID=2593676 RepID=UPI003679BF27